MSLSSHPPDPDTHITPDKKIKVVCFSNQFDTTFECDPRRPGDFEVGPGGD